MTSLFQNETELVKIVSYAVMSFLVVSSWMNLRLGEGGEEFGNHGGSTANSFSQETEASYGQQGEPRKGIPWPTLKRFKCRMHADALSQLPFFCLVRTGEVGYV